MYGQKFYWQNYKKANTLREKFAQHVIADYSNLSAKYHFSLGIYLLEQIRRSKLNKIITEAKFSFIIASGFLCRSTSQYDPLLNLFLSFQVLRKEWGSNRMKKSFTGFS